MRGLEQNMQRYVRPAILIVVIAATSLFAIRAHHNSHAVTSLAPVSVPHVNVARACDVATATRHVYYGEIIAPRTVNARFDVQGTIDWVHPKLRSGERVPANAALARLDPKPLMLAFRKAVAAQRRAESELEHLKVRLETRSVEARLERDHFDIIEKVQGRASELAATGIGTQATLDDRTREVNRAAVVLNAARQAVSEIEAQIVTQQAVIEERIVERDRAAYQLSRAFVAAPFDAMIANVEAEIGGVAGPEASVASLYDPSSLEVRFTVPFSHLSDTFGVEGQNLNGKIDSTTVTVNRRHGSGRLALEATDIRRAGINEGQSGGISFFGRLPSSAGEKLRPGAFVSVTVEAPPPKGTVLIPTTAFQDGFVLVAQGTENSQGHVPIEKRPVHVADVVNDGIIVKADITSEHNLVVTPVHDIRSTTHVRLRTDGQGTDKWTCG